MSPFTLIGGMKPVLQDIAQYVSLHICIRLSCIGSRILFLFLEENVFYGMLLCYIISSLDFGYALVEDSLDVTAGLWDTIYK